MSWETLITGEFKLKNPTDNDILLIQNYLEFGQEVEKINFRFEDGTTVIEFVSLNWLSHITEEKIAELLNLLKDKLVDYWITVYFLDRPDLEFCKRLNS